LTPIHSAFVWLGGAWFVASLVLFGRVYFFTWSVDSGSHVRWDHVIVDAALVSAFALHHSLFAREPIKRWLRRVVPADLIRSVFVWTASWLLIAVLLLWRPIGGTAFRLTGWPALINAAVQLTGLYLMVRAVGAIDALDLAGIRRERAVAAAELKVTGAYRLVRHPLYLGWLLLTFGAATMTGDRLVFALLTAVYLCVAIPWEERALEAAFGDAYLRYRRLVRWRMVPFVY
jgi:methanethiol S-methyltransferase